MISKMFILAVMTAILATTILAKQDWDFVEDISEPKPCHIKYRQFTNHTMCLPKSPNARSMKITDAWKKKVVDYHNRMRSEVRPPPADMMKMRWSDELAEMAKRWADACEFRGGLNHDSLRFIPGSMFIGQSISGFTLNIDHALKHWWFEKDEYVYGEDYQEQVKKGRCGYMIGHYTQLVWAKTYLLGCAATNCGFDERNNIIVCNYGPAGNASPFDRPYQAGELCSKCKNCTEQGLCDCGDLNCHTGQIDPSTCTCNCLFEADNVVPDFIENTTCSLNCTGRQCHYCGDELYNDCNKPWTAKKCPHMCNVCPYGMQGYEEHTEHTDGQATVNSTPAPEAAQTKVIHGHSDHDL